MLDLMISKLRIMRLSLSGGEEEGNLIYHDEPDPTV
jgi:hypothetical protein